MVSRAGKRGRGKELAASARKGRAAPSPWPVALRNWPPRRPSLTHPRAPASWGPKALNCLAPPGPRTSSLWQAQLQQPPSRYEPRLSVASVLSIQHPGSRKKPSRGRHTSAPLPALPVALRPLGAHPRSHGRTPTPSAAASPRSAGDRSDKPRLARKRPGPRTHTLRPAPPASDWRVSGASGGGPPEEAAAYWLAAPSLRLSSDFRFAWLLSCSARAVEAEVVDAGSPSLLVSLKLSRSWFLGDRGGLAEAGAAER